jgi:hypothetical protein
MASSITAAQVESAEPDSWTGKPLSVVLETTTEAGDALALKGFTAFQSSTDPDKDAALIRATEIAQEELEPFFRGRPVQEGQGLLLPARGAYDHNYNLLRESGDLTLERAVKNGLLPGIRLIAEYLRDGSWMLLASPSFVKRDKTRRGEREYKDGSDPNSVRAQHSDVYGFLRKMMPGAV